MRCFALLSGLMLAGGGKARGAEPVLSHIHPAAVQLGTNATVKLTGKFDPWPCRIWTDVAGIVFTAAKDAGTFEVAVAANVPPGPHLIRALNDDGASAPVSVFIANAPQTLEQEPNDDLRAPQVLGTTTAECNGRLDKNGDVDSFLVTLKKGQTMVTRVEAFVLAAGCDAMLRVVDAKGNTLAFNHDHITMDPFIVFVAPEDGDYVIQTMGQKYPASSEINFAGGGDCVYRLHVSTAPYVRNTWPLAVQRGKKTPVALEGWNLAATQVEIDETAPQPFPVHFSDVPELTETVEPQTLEIPSAVSARIDPPGDEDRFTFSAMKDSVLEFTVTGHGQGSAIDAWLKVVDQDGKELASNDDSGGSSDPRIVWTAPADGNYAVVAGDLTGGGGNDFFYRLLISRPAPQATATLAVHSAKVEAGKSAELKVSVKMLNGFQQKLKLAARGLPAGITATETDVPEKGGEATITLTADASAARASQPFQLFLRKVEGGGEENVRFSMASTSEDNGVPQGYRQLLINTTDQLWLTVSPPPPPPPPDPAADTKKAP